MAGALEPGRACSTESSWPLSAINRVSRPPAHLVYLPYPLQERAAVMLRRLSELGSLCKLSSGTVHMQLSSWHRLLGLWAVLWGATKASATKACPGRSWLGSSGLALGALLLCCHAVVDCKCRSPSPGSAKFGGKKQPVAVRRTIKLHFKCVGGDAPMRSHLPPQEVGFIHIAWRMIVLCVFGKLGLLFLPEHLANGETLQLGVVNCSDHQEGMQDPCFLHGGIQSRMTEDRKSLQSR